MKGVECTPGRPVRGGLRARVARLRSGNADVLLRGASASKPPRRERNRVRRAGPGVGVDSGSTDADAQRKEAGRLRTLRGACLPTPGRPRSLRSARPPSGPRFPSGEPAVRPGVPSNPTGYPLPFDRRSPERPSTAQSPVTSRRVPEGVDGSLGVDHPPSRALTRLDARKGSGPRRRPNAPASLKAARKSRRRGDGPQACRGDVHRYGRVHGGNSGRRGSDP